MTEPIRVEVKQTAKCSDRAPWDVYINGNLEDGGYTTKGRADEQADALIGQFRLKQLKARRNV